MRYPSWGLLVLLATACGSPAADADVVGTLTYVNGAPVAGIPVKLMYRTDSGEVRERVDTTDATGTFVVRGPASRLVHVAATFGECTLLDHDVVTPPSGLFALRGEIRNRVWHVMAVDSTTEWGQAFHALQHGSELRLKRIPLHGDAANAEQLYRDSTVSTLMQVWRAARNPLIRQSLAATVLTASARSIAPTDATVMLREIDVASHVYDQFPYSLVLERAQRRAIYSSVPTGALPYDARVQATLRATMDSALRDPRATPPVRASALVFRARSLEQDGDTAAARTVRESAKRQFPVLLAFLETSPRATPAGPLRAPRVFRDFSALTVHGNAPDSLGRHSLRSRYTLLDFWATWCGPCILEIPRIAEEYSRRDRTRFDVISVSLDTDTLALRLFRERRHPMPWRHWRLAEGLSDPTARDVGASILPYTLLLDSEWRIVAEGGALRGANLRKTLDLIGAAASVER